MTSQTYSIMISHKKMNQADLRKRKERKKEKKKRKPQSYNKIKLKRTIIVINYQIYDDDKLFKSDNL